MEKNTILAVVLSTVVLIIFFMIQGFFFAPEVPQADPSLQYQQPVTSAETAPFQEQQPAQQQTGVQAEAVSVRQEYITINTELVSVVLTNAGGNMVSWKLLDHKEDDDNVEMIFRGNNEPQGFAIAFGGLDARPVSDLFNVNRISNHSVEFYQEFRTPAGGETFRLVKRYDFKPKDYMFELTITLDGGYSMNGFNFAGYGYTLSFGPQIGPRFERLDNRNDFRRYLMYENGKRRNPKVNDIIDTRPTWAAIEGKYFSFIAIPNIANYTISFTDTAEAGIPQASRFNLLRPPVSASRVDDKYYFYLGPKSQDVLTLYDTGRSPGYGTLLSNYNLGEAASTRGILAPLERLLKWLLLIFYRVVRNYGIAIILLTLLVKIVFFPLTRKGSEATLRMQALTPKMNEIREKYKDNPQKMNAEMAEFYKKEGYNPLSGCLPMLLQIPLFIAMYNLFNNHFDLRGAMFIPGWIPDLSIPEAIWNFPNDFRIPILGWTALRGLPFIYVGSQLLYGKVTQTPGQQSGTQMKLMLYVMPIMFFFILYNVPSGLLIYWIFSNVLTLVQQVIINKYLKKKKQKEPEAQPVIAPKKGPVIAPPKKKKKKNR